MKGSLLASSALTSTMLLIGTGGPAQADWRGIYLGGGGSVDFVRDQVITDIHGSVSFAGAAAYFGTITAGYNWGPNPYFFGVEADLNFIHYANSGFTDGIPYGAFVETTLDHLLTLRARAGVQVGPAFLFGTGGLAAANLSLSTCYAEPGKSCDAEGSGSGYRLGFVLGGGFEVPATERVSFSFDTLYFRLHDLTVEATGSAPYTAAYQPSGVLMRGAIHISLK